MEKYGKRSNEVQISRRSWDVISAVCILNGGKFTPSNLTPIWSIFMLLSRGMPSTKSSEYSEYLIMSHYLLPSFTHSVKWPTLPHIQTFTFLDSHFISIWFWTLSWLYYHSCSYSLMVSSFCPSMSSFLFPFCAFRYYWKIASTRKPTF